MLAPSVCHQPFARRILLALLVGAFSLPLAAAAQWRVVPGTEDLELDLASVELQDATVTAWVRHAPGFEAFRPFVRDSTGKAPPGHRAVLLTQVDCRQRTLKTLATQLFDRHGRVLQMSSIPSTVRPLPQGEGMGWLHDALCDLLRGRRAEGR